MARADVPSYLDGSAIPLTDTGVVPQNFEHAQIEHWGSGAGNGVDKSSLKQYSDVPGIVNTTYKALRIMGPGYNWYYSVWCTNEHELYDMTVDSQQLNNLHQPFELVPVKGELTESSRYLYRLETRLDALLLVLKSCKATTCIRPWNALHSSGNVQNLLDAMDPAYDDFYQKHQNRVSYHRCEPGYIIAAEGPQAFIQYEQSQEMLESQ